MFLDFSRVTIGDPEAVFPGLADELGRLNFSATNLKTGVTSQPRQAPPASDNGWRVMRLLWCTHSLAKARQMASLLRAWDGKLFVPPDGGEPAAGPWWAFALLR